MTEQPITRPAGLRWMDLLAGFARRLTKISPPRRSAGSPGLLSDRELKDIGLKRDEVSGSTGSPYWDRPPQPDLTLR